MFQYIPYRETLFSPYIGLYHSYGIAALLFTDLDWELQAYVSDISPDGSFVLALAQRCTRGQLSPIHLLDVVLNAL